VELFISFIAAFCFEWVKGSPWNKQQGGGVSHCGIAIYIKKYLQAKEDIWKLNYFTMQKYNLQKKSSQKNQNISRYYNSIT